jgi:hypothetical protein
MTSALNALGEALLTKIKYDSDTKADIAVFRPSTGMWYLQQTTAGFTSIPRGAASDVPTENAFIP